MGFLFTMTMGKLFTIVLGIQLTISKIPPRVPNTYQKMLKSAENYGLGLKDK